MSFLLDTSILIEIENGNKSVIKKIDALKRAPKAGLYISVFTYAEFFFGFRNRTEKNKQKAKERLHSYNLLNTTQKTAEIFCTILHTLTERGMVVPHFDVFIAALAIEHGLTIVTTDEHFNSISGLKRIVFRI